MKYIILIHKLNFYEEVANLSEKIGESISIRKYGENLESELYISPLSDRDEIVHVHSPEPLVLEEYYDTKEMNDVINLIKEPKTFLTSNMEYKNFNILHQVLVIIAENTQECYVDNDFGTLLSAYNFVEKWNNNPDWNWINDLDD